MKIKVNLCPDYGYSNLYIFFTTLTSVAAGTAERFIFKAQSRSHELGQALLLSYPAALLAAHLPFFLLLSSDYQLPFLPPPSRNSAAQLTRLPSEAVTKQTQLTLLFPLGTDSAVGLPLLSPLNSNSAAFQCKPGVGALRGGSR